MEEVKRLVKNEKNVDLNRIVEMRMAQERSVIKYDYGAGRRIIGLSKAGKKLS
mgnify:FL=1